ncbi:hypothetical protein AGMMS50212_07140 [Spirochaetia bacterium]|nr:hypothetical protein AGMMS50212_06970 [Spirochaetia bacterium]GHV83374.1 hypothetical protein AGMMS50212_07140 [Spirochaetia bacterium]
MSESEKIDRLTAGYRRLNEEGKNYLRDVSQQLIYVQYPIIVPAPNKVQRKISNSAFSTAERLRSKLS